MMMNMIRVLPIIIIIIIIIIIRVICFKESEVCRKIKIIKQDRGISALSNKRTYDLISLKFHP